MASSLSYQRKCAVSKAWAKERQQVLNSCGSRNWSQEEQKEILQTGKCHGYEGQHMLSVKAHPEQAGNENNIQFLTRGEHFKAHRGNWKNDANGKYDPKTGEIEPFNDGIPSVKYGKLSDPISERSKTIANNRYQAGQRARQSGTPVSSKPKLPVRKQELSGSANGEQKPNDIPPTPEEASQKAEGQNISNGGHEPVAKSSNEPKQDENENLNGIREQEPSAEKHGTTNGQNISNGGHEPVARSSNEPKQDENENLNGIREQDPSTEKHGTTNDQSISNDGHEPVAKSSNEPKQNENENLNGIREQNPSAEKHGMTNDQSNGIHEPVTDTPNNAKTNEASNGIQDTPKNTPTQSAAEKDNGISGSDTGRSNGADKSVNMTE